MVRSKSRKKLIMILGLWGWVVWWGIGEKFMIMKNLGRKSMWGMAWKWIAWPPQTHLTHLMWTCNRNPCWGKGVKGRWWSDILWYITHCWCCHRTPHNLHFLFHPSLSACQCAFYIFLELLFGAASMAVQLRLKALSLIHEDQIYCHTATENRI